VGALPLSSPTDRDKVEALLEEVASGAGSLGWLGAVALLYSASGAIGALRHAMDQAWGVHGRRAYFPGKGLDIGLTLIAAPIALVALGLTLSGALADAIGDHPWLVAAARFAVTRVVPATLLLGILVALFRLLPAERSSLRSAWPGALVALVLILLVHAGTTAYVAAFGQAKAVYGTLGILLGLVFSAYLVAVASVAGAHVSAELARLPDTRAIEIALSEKSGTSGRQLVTERLRGLFARER
jgi:membrane protein